MNQHPGAIVDARIQALYTEGMYGFLALNVGAKPLEGPYFCDYIWAYLDSRRRVVQKFYDALPNDMKNELKRTIWEANNRSDYFMGIRYGTAFEDRMIQYHTDGPLVRAALRQYLSNFGVDTSINS